MNKIVYLGLAIAVISPHINALSFDEVLNQIQKVENSSTGKAIKYENYFTYEYRPVVGFSIHPKEERVASTTSFYKINAAYLEDYNNALFTVRLLKPKVNDILNNKSQTLSSLYSSDEIAYELNDALDSHYTGSEIKAGVALTKKQAKTFKQHLNYLADEIDSALINTNYDLLIGSANSGDQKLYLQWEEKCDVDIVTETKILKVSGQNVQFYSFCDKYTDSTDTYRSLTTKSDAGEKYMVKKFRELEWVTISNPTAPGTIKFWANGFTEAWDQFGGDAL